MVFSGLVFIAVVLTVAMFATRNSMLGFPCGIFWAILMGYCYNASVYDWDIYYFIFFASFGMVVFTIFAAFALRHKDITGPDDDKEKYIDEGVETESGGIKESDTYTDESAPSRKVQEVRNRAKQRRMMGVSKKKGWGEFK